MRRLLIAILVGAMAAAIAVAVSAGNAPKKESAVVEFANTVKLTNVLLRGQYLIVHDEERMAKGEACTYVYKGKIENADKLVTSFHCTHMDRVKTDKIRISYSSYGGKPYETPEIVEIQFANSADGHRVPGK
ncbi:MAG: hypothetical protein SF097_09210 [Acidobacteriota bacterium]|nr:hypothetical protein [Acidobacteriota bacterium]